MTSAHATGTPVLESLSISPSTVNTTSSSQNVTVTAHILEPEPGVSEARVTLQIPGGSAEGPLKLVSGTHANGTYTAILTIPRGSIPGIWGLSMEIYGIQGSAILPQPALEAKEFPSTVNVESIPPSDKPPRLDRLSISPRTVNVTTTSQNVTVTAHILQPEPGVSEVRVTLAHPGGSVEGPLKLVSGTHANGTYTGILTIPRGSIPGIWGLSMEIYGVQGIGAILPQPVLEAKGFPSTVNVESIPPSNKPPHLDRLSISPRTVNVTTTSQNVTVTAHILDPEPGVSEVRVRLGGVEGPLKLVSGTPANGTYTGILTIPRGSIPEVWGLSMEIYPIQGNAAILPQPVLEARGFPSTVTIE